MVEFEGNSEKGKQLNDLTNEFQEIQKQINRLEENIYEKRLHRE